eukprot:1145264-Rhodomonas_salina.1
MLCGGAAISWAWYPRVPGYRAKPGLVPPRTKPGTRVPEYPRVFLALLLGFANVGHQTECQCHWIRDMLCGGAISWASRANRQAVVALSSSEAAFDAASASGCDVAYLHMILDQLQVGIPQPETQPTSLSFSLLLRLAHVAFPPSATARAALAQRGPR